MTRGGDSVSLLLDAARRLEPVSPRLARDTYLDALMAAMFTGHLAGGASLTDAARAARGHSDRRTTRFPLIFSSMAWRCGSQTAMRRQCQY